MQARKPLTADTLAVYEVIERYYGLTGRAPSFQEMKDATGLMGNASIQNHLNRLEDAGYIQRERKIARGIIPVHYPRVHYRPMAEKHRGK